MADRLGLCDWADHRHAPGQFQQAGRHSRWHCLPAAPFIDRIAGGYGPGRRPRWSQCAGEGRTASDFQNASLLPSTNARRTLRLTNFSILASAIFSLQSRNCDAPSEVRLEPFFVSASFKRALDGASCQPEAKSSTPAPRESQPANSRGWACPGLPRELCAFSSRRTTGIGISPRFSLVWMMKTGFSPRGGAASSNL